MASLAEQYKTYLDCLNGKYRYKSYTKLEFLNLDNTVAYVLDNEYKRNYAKGFDTRAFIKTGSITTSFNDGQRRTATITLENIDNAFDYAVNKIWYGNKVRISKGITLPNGEIFWLSQGVFLFDSPSKDWKPNSRQIQYSLKDKWSYLDGSLFGNLQSSVQIDQFENIFEVIRNLLQHSIYTQHKTTNKLEMLDNMTPIFTTYYNDTSKIYNTINNIQCPMYLSPQELTTNIGDSYASLLLDLNEMLVGNIGYDKDGRLRIESSQESILDNEKEVLWEFSPKNSALQSLKETMSPTSVFNDVIIWGENLSGGIVGGRATNKDARADTNINIVGRKIYAESSNTTYTTQQAMDMAEWYLYKKSSLQKTVTITSNIQLLHLRENRIVTVERTDKENSPIERYLVTGFTLPLDDTSSMSITATSTNDKPTATVTAIDVSQVDDSL